MTRRWKLTDIVAAITGDPDDNLIWGLRSFFGKMPHASDEARVEAALRKYNVTFPYILKMSEREWERMTNEQRCAVLVAAAKRLNVPRR